VTTLFVRHCVVAFIVVALAAGGRVAWAAQEISLPAPLKMPQGSPDARAAALAKEVLAVGKSALPALLTAMQAAGFGVIETDRRVLVEPAQPSQGLAFDPWEAEGIARACAARMTIPLNNVGLLPATVSRSLRPFP
jgi:hypothetical protein